MAGASEISLTDLEELFNDDCFSEESSSNPTTLEKDNSTQQNNIVFLQESETQEIIKTIKSTNLTFAEIEIYDGKVLNDLIQQLSCCFQRRPFPSSSAKASWSSFHGVVTKCISKFDSILPHSFLTLFAIKYFEKLINKNLYEKSSENDIKVLNLNSDEKNIVYYIGGSIIKKLLNVKNCVLQHEILNNLKADQHNLSIPHSELAHLVDRGGLTYLNNNSAAFFIGLEICFRNMYPLSQIDHNISISNYRLRCLSNSIIKNDFYDAVTKENTFIDKEMENVMTLCIDKYFIIRAHQKCRRMIASHRSAALANKRKSQGKKSLRKNLKVCVEQTNMS